MLRMQLRGRCRFESTQLVALTLDIHVVDTDGLDADVLDVGSQILEVTDRVRLDDLGSVVVEEYRISWFEVVHVWLFLRDSDEVQDELLGEDTTMVEPSVWESLIAEALDRIGENTNSDVFIQIAQMGILVE